MRPVLRGIAAFGVVTPNAYRGPLSSIVKTAVDGIARSLNDLGISSLVRSRSRALLRHRPSTAVNSVNTTLGLIKTTLAGSLNINAIYADGESSVYNGSAGLLPAPRRLPCGRHLPVSASSSKGYAVTGIVGPDALAAANGVLIYFADGGNSNAVVAPVATIHKVAVADVTAFTAGNSGTSVTGTPVVVNLGSGRRGAATGSSGPLKLTTDITIGVGDIKVVGVVWGAKFENAAHMDRPVP